MAPKDLLVYVDQTDNAFTRLRMTANLAVSHGARLTALFVREWSQHHWDRRKAAELGLVSADKMAQLDNHTRASIEGIADKLRTTLMEVTSGRGVRAELLCLDGTASVLVPQYARYADLCIVGRDEPQGSASINYSFPSNCCL